jgi:excisionase family DNA binding protein
MIESDILTAEEVATHLRLAVPTIYKMAQRGDIPAVRMGRSWRFSRHLLDEWLEERMQANLDGKYGSGGAGQETAG